MNQSRLTQLLLLAFQLFFLAFQFSADVHASIARTGHNSLADSIEAVDVGFITYNNLKF